MPSAMQNAVREETSSEISVDGAKWENLRSTLRNRYESAAEIFVAFGGRVGYQLSLRDFERSLRDLDTKIRRTSPTSALDVHGLMADVEKRYPEGMTFMTFANLVKWPSRQSKTTSDNTRNNVKKANFLVGSPAAALRGGRGEAFMSSPIENQNSLKKTKGEDRPVTDKKSATFLTHKFGDAKKVMFQTLTSKETIDEVAQESAHHMQQPPTSSALGARWRPTRPKSASATLHHRTKQHDALASSQKNAHIMKRLRLIEQREKLQTAEEKLFSLLDDSEDQNSQSQPLEREKKQGFDESQILAPASHPKVSDNRKQDKSHSQAQQILSPDAIEFQSRLATLDSTVFEQRISLAETEKNVLLRERYELQAQLRQMEVERRQTQAAMQNEFTQQMAVLIQTFDKVGQALANSGQKEVDAKAEKKELAKKKAAFERKIRDQLLSLADFQGQGCTLKSRLSVQRETLWDCVFSHSAETEGMSGNNLAENIRVQIKELRPENLSNHSDDQKWIEGQIFIQSRPTLAQFDELQSSAFVDAITHCLEYNPVCSWYNTDCDGDPEGGSIGLLSRLDPVNDEDFINEFLLEVLIALRLNQMFRCGLADTVRTIFPVFVGGDEPVAYSQKFGAFPVDKLSLLSSFPSIETNKAAALILKSIGVPISEDFLRTSIREAISILLGMPCIRMDRYESRREAILDAANKVQGIARAEWQTLIAKDMLDIAAKAVETAVSTPGAEDSSSDEDDVWDDDHSKIAAQKRKRLEKTDRKIRIARVHQIAHDTTQKAENKKNDAFSAWKMCFEQLGMESNSSNLAHRNLLDRGIKNVSLPEKRSIKSVTIPASEDQKLRGQRIHNQIAQLQRRRLCGTWFSYNRIQASQRLEEAQNLRTKMIKLKDLSGRLVIHAQSLQRSFWDAWQETRGLDDQFLTNSRPSEFNGANPGNLALALQNLQHAVIEAHSKHSALIERTNNDAVFQNLLDSISLQSADSMRQSGICNLHQLKTLGLNGTELNKDALAERNITNKQDLLKIHACLIDKEDSLDFDEKQQLLLREMAELRQRLEVKRSQLDADVLPSEQDHIDNGTKDEDKSLSVLQKLLHALGAPSSAFVSMIDDDGQKAAADESPVFEGDRRTMEYKRMLMMENGAHQTVLEMLDESLGPASRPGQSEEEMDSQSAKKDLIVKQEAMQLAINHFVQVMEKAKQLLNPKDQDAMTAKARKNGNHILDPQFTQAELDAIRLAEDVKRRSQQAKLLEQENRMLRENLKYSKVNSRGDAETHADHWASSISDPALAAKYLGHHLTFTNVHTAREYSGATAKPDEVERDDSVNKINDKPVLAWELEPVDSSMMISRASIFEQELERRMVKGRQMLSEKISKVQDDYDAVTKQLTRMEAKMTNYQAPSKVVRGMQNVKHEQKDLRPHEEMILVLKEKQRALDKERNRLEKEYEGLDRKKELQRMDDEIEAELEAAEEQLQGLRTKLQFEMCQDADQKLKEAQENVNRLHATRLIRKRLREKEMEMEVLGEKMREDEMHLKQEQDQLNSAAALNAIQVQKKLSESLRDMSEMVSQTARGRCRPEVIASLNGVQKVRRAIERHRLAVETARLSEHNNQLKQAAEEKDRETAGLKQKAFEELRAKEKGTTEIVQRERYIKETRAEIEKKGTEMMENLLRLVKDAKSCLDGKSEYHEMTNLETYGKIYHIKSYLTKAKNMCMEIENVVKTSGAQTDSKLKERLADALIQTENIQTIVKESESKFFQALSNAVLDMDALLKRDMRHVQTSQPAEIMRVSKAAERLRAQLDAVNMVQDAPQVKGSSLMFLEQKFRNAWLRLKAKIDESLHRTLAQGDRGVDEAQIALKSGKLAMALQELDKAETMFETVKTAKTTS